MTTDLEIWRFASSRLQAREGVVLMVVAESTGSSPGRQGYKMAVGSNGAMIGSIGGGVMEVRLVELAKGILSEPGAVREISASSIEPPRRTTVATGFRDSAISEQVHQKNSPNSSGMICSGKQTVIFKRLDDAHAGTVKAIIEALQNDSRERLLFTPTEFTITPPSELDDFIFVKFTETDFLYGERLGKKNDLYIVGGGHCALALSELMSKMDFHIRIFDDRPDLNTIDKNKYADEITIIDSYDRIGEAIRAGRNKYVVVMTLGYASDEIVIRELIEHDLKYFGVLGSRAKMKTLLTALKKAGFAKGKLDRIHTPIGLAINSRTPEEIAVSIAAEIIAVKNGAIGG